MTGRDELPSGVFRLVTEHLDDGGTRAICEASGVLAAPLLAAASLAAPPCNRAAARAAITSTGLTIPASQSISSQPYRPSPSQVDGVICLALPGGKKAMVTTLASGGTAGDIGWIVFVKGPGGWSVSLVRGGYKLGLTRAGTDLIETDPDLQGEGCELLPDRRLRPRALALGRYGLQGRALLAQPELQDLAAGRSPVIAQTASGPRPSRATGSTIAIRSGRSSTTDHLEPLGQIDAELLGDCVARIRDEPRAEVRIPERARDDPAFELGPLGRAHAAVPETARELATRQREPGIDIPACRKIERAR